MQKNKRNKRNTNKIKINKPKKKSHLCKVINHLLYKGMWVRTFNCLMKSLPARSQHLVCDSLLFNSCIFGAQVCRLFSILMINLCDKILFLSKIYIANNFVNLFISLHPWVFLDIPETSLGQMSLMSDSKSDRKRRAT